MSITIVQAAVGNTGGNNNNPAIPVFASAPTVGNVVISAYADYVSATPGAAVNGWTQISQVGNSTNGTSLTFSFRVVKSGDTATYSPPISAASGIGKAIQWEISGLGFVPAALDVAFIESLANGTTSTATSQTTSVAGELVLGAMFMEFLVNPPTATITSSGWTTDVELNSGEWGAIAGHIIPGAAGSAQAMAVNWGGVTAGDVMAGTLLLRPPSPGPNVVQSFVTYPGAGSALLPTLATAPTPGNMLICMWTITNQVTTPVAQNGWTLVGSFVSGAFFAAWVFARFAQSGDTTQVASPVTTAFDNQNSICSLTEVSGVAGTLANAVPIVHIDAAPTGTGSPINITPQTTTAANELALVLALCGGSSNTAFPTASAGWAKIANDPGFNSAYDGAAYSQSFGAAGSTVSATITPVNLNAQFFIGTVVLSGGGGTSTASYAPGSVVLTAPTFSATGVTVSTGSYAPGTVNLTAPTWHASVFANAQLAELDVAALARPLTFGQVAELDALVVARPFTDAQVAELSVAVLAAPPTSTAVSEIDVAVLAYIGPCATKRCQVWKITRTDGQVFAFTSLDTPIFWGGVTYSPCKSLTAGASESSAELDSVGSVELTGILDAEAITDADLYAGKFDDARVEVWLIPYDGRPDDGAPTRLAAGNMGKVTRGEHNFTAEVLGPGGRLKQAALVDFYTPGCRWDFGDANCGVDAEARKIAAVPVVAGGFGRQLVAFEASDPGGSIFNNGKVVWLTGRNAGTSCQVETVDFGAQKLSLWDLAPFPPAIGDTFDLLPGCPLTKAGCQAYSNFVRYGGFMDIPGPDAMQSNADSAFT